MNRGHALTGIFSSVSICAGIACGGRFELTDGLDASVRDGSENGEGDRGTGDGSRADASKDGPDGDASGTEGGVDGGVGDSGLSCHELLAKMDKVRNEARQCCAICEGIQCAIAVQDLCCPFSTTHGDVAKAFEELLKEHGKKCLPVDCPAIPCQPAPSYACVQFGGGVGSVGYCL